MNMKFNDEEIVKRVLTGEAESFGKLIQRYQGVVQGLAYHLTGNFEDAEDIAQETFITAYLKLGQLRNPEKFAAWLKQITFNCCKMWIRKRKESVSLDEVDELSFGVVPSSAEEYEQEEMRRLVHRALSQITEKNRLVITLYYLDGLNYNDIAQFLDMPISTVEGRMHRAKKQLKGRLMKMVEDTLRTEKLSDDFTRRVLDEAIKKAKEAQEQWAKEDFVLSCREALEAAEKLEDSKAQIEILSMLSDAEAMWLGEPEKAIENYESALTVARKHEDMAEEARILKAIFVAHCRHGEYDKMRQRTSEALKLFSGLEDRENEALTRAALDLSDMLPNVWSPGQPGGYAMAVFPIEVSDEGFPPLTSPPAPLHKSPLPKGVGGCVERGEGKVEQGGFRFLDPKSVRNYSYGCPSRCAALVHLLRPRRFLGSSLSIGATWDDRITRLPDGLSWGIAEGDELIAKAEVESEDDIIVTPAGRFEGCLRVRTIITPMDGGTATEYTTRSYCGTRMTWFAPGVGLVKLRHEDQNETIWAVYLVEHEGSGGEEYFPLSVGRMWRYRWMAWNGMFEDICRVISNDGNTFYISSATWAVEQSEDDVERYFSEILELEKRANDLVGEATALEEIVWRLGKAEKERKGACYERLVEIYESLRDEWKLIDARWHLRSFQEQLPPYERTQWEEKLAIARKLGDRRKMIRALKVLSSHHHSNGEYERAAELMEEAADIAFKESDAVETARCISSAEFAKEINKLPSTSQRTYVHGVGTIVEKEKGELYSKGSSRGSVAGEYPPGPKGTPMTDFFWYEPFSGVGLLSDKVGSSSTDWCNISVLKNACESMRMISSLVNKEEKVKVPAGEFSKCALIETRVSASDEDRKFGPELEHIRGYYAGVKKAWFAPGVGLVRLLYQHKNGYSTDIQLVEYEIAELSEDYFPLALNNRWRYRWVDQKSGTVFEDSLRVASRKEGQWNIAFVTRATALEYGNLECVSPPY
jgi:RNA polymerase sigma-70 factor (ECF subfamily)